MNWMKTQKIILASQSPRRKELLAQAGFEFDVMVADIDEENFPADLAITDLPAYLAQKKAQKIFDLHHTQDRLILAADSLVFKDQRIYTKPIDRSDAIYILDSLQGQKHEVITGVCLLSADYLDIRSVLTEVVFEPMSKPEIEYYIDVFKPYDKAGAYGIQDWIGLCKVKEIRGSYSNIMGLPMNIVYTMLEKYLTKA